MMNFKYFHRKIQLFLVSLLLILLLAIYLSVARLSLQAANEQATQALGISEHILQNRLADQAQVMLQHARLLSSDYAFKKIFHLKDRPTIESALLSYQQRAAADFVVLADLESHRILASTQAQVATHFADQSLLTQAYESDDGEHSQLGIVDGQLYQLVAVPLYTPDPVGWVIIAYRINGNFADDLKQATLSDVAIFYQEGAEPDEEVQWQVGGSSLEPEQTAALLALHASLSEGSANIEIADDLLALKQHRVESNETNAVKIILLHSLAESLAPFQRLNKVIAIVFFIAMIIACLALLFFSRHLLRSIPLLAKMAQAVGRGETVNIPESKRRDEVGQLINAFAAMQKDLLERDKIHALLGKVVSPAVAKLLLDKGIELGGEEREVSALFTDIRNFTSVCEDKEPKAILDFLNHYFNQLSHIISQHEGVVDKYIGDAIMAIFGAPAHDPDHPEHAVDAALAMQSRLQKLNQQLIEDGKAPIIMGIGVNTASVVAGNMGSEERLNYTVLGDGVNLASRIEGLSKHYDVGILVSEATKQRCPNIAFREIDRVRVKGRQDAVSIFEPLGHKTQIDEKMKQELIDYKQALRAFQNNDHAKALNDFTQLSAAHASTKLYQIYLQRIKESREDQGFALVKNFQDK